MNDILYLRKEMIDHATGCDFMICKTCRNIVTGDGSTEAEIMFIGEAPGAQEDAEGRPFVGKSGKLLNQLLATIDLKRPEVYITNVVKARPPGNADPTPEEVDHYMPWLGREIEIIAPRIIVPLGLHALRYFIENTKVGDAHGLAILSKLPYMIFPMYHPANALYNPAQLPTLQADFKTLRLFL